MKLYILPDDFLPNGKSEPVQIINFQSNVSLVKGKIRLAKHAFNFLMEGEKTVYYADRKIKIDNSQFVLLANGNCIMTEKVVARGGIYKGIAMFFDDHILSDYFTRHVIMPPMENTAAVAQPLMVFNKDRLLNNFVESLDMMLNCGAKITPEMQRLKFDEIMHYLCLKHPDKISDLKNTLAYSNSEAELRKVVEANIHGNLSVEELAFLCNTSLSTFKRKFAKIYDTSPNQWILQKRMEAAAEHLTKADIKVSDVYINLGYENLSSFIQAFKQVYGITPKQYQKQNERIATIS